VYARIDFDTRFQLNALSFFRKVIPWRLYGMAERK